MKCLLAFTAALLIVFAPVESVFYTRWGRTTCPDGTSILYTGYVMGGWYTHSGNGADYLCVSDLPQWNNIVSGNQAYSAYIYGTEYQLSGGYTNNQPFSYANNAGQDLHDQNAPCVVCIRYENNNVAMVPGKFSCPIDGMTLEYKGYLMAAYYGHQKANWICVDQAPEVIPGMSANTDGALLYPVQVSCSEGSIPCPPMVHGNEFTCAVCTL